MKKTLFSLASAFAAVAVLFSACNKVEQPDDPQKPGDKPGQEEVYAEVPFETITLTAGAETVEGTIGENSVSFKFAEVEDFTACSYNFEVNKGWTCTWPTDPKNVDLTVDENLVLQFTSPKNAIVKYYISFTSNSLPIADASKIKVAGDPAAVVEVNNAKKTLKIYYNQETMNEAAIELVFEEGALIPGATYEGTAFDFTETLSNPFVIKTSTGDVTYTLKLDKSSLMPNPATLGFSDITADYTDAEGVTIFKASAINGVPERQRFYGGSQFVQETPYGPYDGWIYMNSDPDKTVWVALGDWTEDRTKVNIDPCEVVVVLLIPAYILARVYCPDEVYTVALACLDKLVQLLGLILGILLAPVGRAVIGVILRAIDIVVHLVAPVDVDEREARLVRPRYAIEALDNTAILKVGPVIYGHCRDGATSSNGALHNLTQRLQGIEGAKFVKCCDVDTLLGYVEDISARL